MPDPQRIQRRRTRGWKVPPNTVSVSRPGMFANKFAVEFHKRWKVWLVLNPGRERMGMFALEADAHKFAVDLYQDAMSPDDIDWAKRVLQGSNLMCWCPPPPDGIADRDWCHGGRLLELVNPGLKCEAA